MLEDGLGKILENGRNGSPLGLFSIYCLCFSTIKSKGIKNNNSTKYVHECVKLSRGRW